MEIKIKDLKKLNLSGEYDLITLRDILNDLYKIYFQYEHENHNNYINEKLDRMHHDLVNELEDLVDDDFEIIYDKYKDLF